MDISNLIKILSVFENTTTEKTEIKKESVYEQFKRKYVLVRHHKMGVNVGYLTSYDDDNFVLSETRKLWRWQAKKSIALESVAKFGLTDGTRATATVNQVIIPKEELCGIITVDDNEVIENIKNFAVTDQD